jgi:hypothetical protein
MELVMKKNIVKDSMLLRITAIGNDPADLEII